MSFLQSLKTRWQNASGRRRFGVVAVVLALLALVVLPFVGSDESDNDIIVDGAQTQDKSVLHTVVAGDYIIKIAWDYKVPWQAVAVANEAALARLNAERCADLSDRYTNRRGRRGHYCNELVVIGGKPMVHLNSLQPGDKIVVPLTSHPVVDSVVNAIPGSSIAIVIDDTGSMNDDRVEVGAWYIRASGQFQRDIKTVVLYADGHVQEFTSTGEVTFSTSGNLENTRHALETAAASHPSAIVLVSDEPGDDWGNWDLTGLPPVYVHSLEEGAHENLRRVATTTGGQFMRPPLAKVLANR